jgi:hypothetical protein
LSLVGSRDASSSQPSACEQLSSADVERERNADNRAQGLVPIAAFDTAYVGPRKVYL